MADPAPKKTAKKKARAPAKRIRSGDPKLATRKLTELTEHDVDLLLSALPDEVERARTACDCDTQLLYIAAVNDVVESLIGLEKVRKALRKIQWDPEVDVLSRYVHHRDPIARAAKPLILALASSAGKGVADA